MLDSSEMRHEQWTSNVELLAALKRGDGAAATAIVEEHMSSSLRRLLDRLTRG